MPAPAPLICSGRFTAKSSPSSWTTPTEGRSWRTAKDRHVSFSDRARWPYNLRTVGRAPYVRRGCCPSDCICCGVCYGRPRTMVSGMIGATLDTPRVGDAPVRRPLLPNVGGEKVVETHGLTKRYGTGIVAVDTLDLNVYRGEVYGFLGPNGAGKTTPLRMLLGLIRPTAGSAKVVGAAPGSPASLIKVGAIVETPAFYPYMTGYDNLRLLATYCGVDRSRVDATLAEVDLTPRAHHKFSTYSLGMKQRLGIAAALLKEPELLILDEPTNGLDPQGMADVRNLIIELGKGARTVLISSHLLGEVELMCTRVGVIRKGKIVAEGTVDQLRGAATLLVRATPEDTAKSVLVEEVG